ncbi:unnamed protein product [Citrullus colocynthis]|uniref:Uncharacterized protein n=1 Tax=Citrullus colocynthis TaxID=252529 RepID=A0ABP0ZC02_9ROSI
MENSINSSTFWLWGLHRRLDFEEIQNPFLFFFNIFIHEICLYKGNNPLFQFKNHNPGFFQFEFKHPISLLGFRVFDCFQSTVSPASLILDSGM